MYIQSQEDLKSISLNQFPHFSFDELKCKCCNSLLITDQSLEFFNLLEEFRNYVKAKTGTELSISVTNSYRCPHHNKEIGGAKKSAHTKAIAGDIYIKGLNILKVFLLAESFKKFKRIGYYPFKGFIHVDIKKPIINKYWYQDQFGKYHYYKTHTKLLRSMKK